MTHSEDGRIAYDDAERVRRKSLEAARQAGYIDWLNSLDRQVDEGTLTRTERNEMISRALLARDIVGDKEYTDARTDPLTQLGNRKLFNEQLGVLTTQPYPFGMLIVDLDGFKLVNDTHGHPIGDQVLVQTALRITSQVRQIVVVKPGGVYASSQTDRQADIATRYGGEEFAILMPSLDSPTTLFDRAEQIRGAIGNNPFRIESLNIAIPVTASIGAGIYDSGDPLSFLHSVDHACLRAKAAGRNRTILA